MDKDQKQFSEQRDRWNSRAESWDEEIKNPQHYANFEDGYQKFLDFEREQLTGIKQKEAGIDLGCGSGETAVLLAHYVKSVYLLDLAEKMLEEAKKKVPGAVAIHASATDIPLGDDSVDIAISRGVVVSHLPEKLTDDFFNGLARIVRSGGKVIFDFLSNMESADFQIASPKITFTKQQIISELESRGFAEIIFDGDDTNRVIRVSAIKK